MKRKHHTKHVSHKTGRRSTSVSGFESRWVTPGSAEGDLETIEADLRSKFGPSKKK